MRLKFLLFLCCGLLFGASFGQKKIGVVLSGGGAKGIAHVGFLKALEENNIPIDYITGTSFGALVGAMYCSGYTIAEMEAIFLSNDFSRMVTGEIDDKYQYFFKKPEPDASLANIKFSKNALVKALPTNVIDPIALDYELLRTLSGPAAVAKYDFDNLYIPFRCVASDIEKNDSYVFRDGNLNEAVRASATYPFYVQPIEVNGKLLFDGGLYNNFPADIMLAEFKPDVIIGSNVTENETAPEADDFFSLLRNMIVYKTNFEKVIDEMYVVQSRGDVSTFEFEKAQESFDLGYNSTIAQMDSVKYYANLSINKADREGQRNAFRAQIKRVVIDSVQVSGLDKGERAYVRSLFTAGKDTVSLANMKKDYFRIFAEDKIKYLYPIAKYNPETGRFMLDVRVKKEKDLLASFGGNFSSRPLNMGFIGLKYHIFGRSPLTLEANSYFGKFYGSIKVGGKIDIAAKVPFSIKPYLGFNRYDFFRSLSTFFEDVKPSFIVQSERFGGVEFYFPAGNKSRVFSDVSYFENRDDYYQTNQFLSTDTTDVTDFKGFTGSLKFERSTLNFRQFANKGTRLSMNVRMVSARETTIPGTTSALRDTLYTNYHQWATAKISYQNYFGHFGPITTGFLIEGVTTTQPFFSNYRATILSSPSFNPLPENNTLFVDRYHAKTYVAGGGQAIYNVSKNFQIRLEAYIMQAIEQVANDGTNQAQFDFSRRQYYMGGTTAVLQTPIGPVSLAVNYFDQNTDRFSVLFNFGYLIFNRRVFD